MGLTIVGLGPGGPELLTREALDVLSSGRRVWLRTRRHPSVSAIPPEVPVESFDRAYESAESFEALYRSIADRLLDQAAVSEVIYAVPGHPLVAEETVRLLRDGAMARAIPLRIVAGLSFVEPALTAIGIDPFQGGLQIADAHDPRIDPFRPALLGQVYHQRLASTAKLALLDHYPAEHPVHVIHHAGLPDQRVEELPLYALDRTDDFDHLTCVYLPSIVLMEGIGSHETLKEVIFRLRRDCPWDREQTHGSLRPYLVEETFEALEALDDGDLTKFAEELGDVLLQIYLHAAIGEEQETFSLREVMAAITTKLIRRHPHVFGDADLKTAEQVAINWEKIKRAERKERGSMLDGVPKSMPALSYVQNIQRRAASVGFEWPNVEGAWQKLAEELAELRSAEGADDRFWELGDVLFVLVDLARWYGFEAEDSLRAAATRFRRRFGWIEEHIKSSGRPFDSHSLDEWLDYWRQSKPLAAAD